MGLIKKMSDGMKRGLRSWLNITPSNPYGIQINEVMDFELSAIRNRIWYRGDSNELEQMYQQNPEYADKQKFWASRCTPGMEMRKIHTGLPGLIVKTLNSIVVADMNEFEFKDPGQEMVWRKIEKENRFRKKLEKSLKEVLYIGDGAYKVTIDTSISQYPLLEWYPGERVELVQERGRTREVVFKIPYTEGQQQYILYEHYGYGYITYELYRDDKMVDINSIEATRGIKNCEFNKSTILAVPLQIYESTKYEGRGGSVFDGKLDSFDAFDEAWSQWMDALRKGRPVKYIAEDMIPRNPETGEMLRSNPFDNSFIRIRGGISESGESGIDIMQPDIPYESYTASYCTALDQCLQGVISPSTLGVDVKKLDNAEAQREKEKATLYTRNAIIEALQETLPELVSACINAYNILRKLPVEEVEVNIPFGEYANPSFESQIETLSKARPGAPTMSVEAQVEELWGDSKDEEWKSHEVIRIKKEMGIAVTEEPGNLDGLPEKGGAADGGESSQPDLPDESQGISGTAADSEGTGPLGDLRG